MTDEMKAKRELLFSGSKNGYDRVDQQTLDAMEAYCRDYKSFLDHSKTERECTAHTVALAEAAGFLRFETLTLAPFDRDALDPALLTASERDWLNGYHRRVYAQIAPLVPTEVRQWLREVTAAL